MQLSVILGLVDEEVDFSSHSTSSKTILKSATDERLSLLVNHVHVHLFVVAGLCLACLSFFQKVLQVVLEWVDPNGSRKTS